jgi:hypothetical protein
MESGWTFSQFLAGIVGAGIGFIVVWRADWMMNNFGRIPFAEKYLTSEGGTRVFYKLVGILIMIVGMMHATGLLEPTIGSLAKTIFGKYFGGGAESEV